MNVRSHIKLPEKSVCLVCVIALLLPFSCKKQTAQYPSNKSVWQESAEISLIDYNQELIQEEDSAILAWVSNQSGEFKKSESGIWYSVPADTSKPLLANDSSCAIRYTAFSLRGDIYFQEETKTVRFGKKEVPTGLEEGLLCLRKGEKAWLIVPSYLAYGARGTDVIPPYTPIAYSVRASEIIFFLGCIASNNPQRDCCVNGRYLGKYGMLFAEHG